MSRHLHDLTDKELRDEIGRRARLRATFGPRDAMTPRFLTNCDPGDENDYRAPCNALAASTAAEIRFPGPTTYTEACTCGGWESGFHRQDCGVYGAADSPQAEPGAPSAGEGSAQNTPTQAEAREALASSVRKMRPSPFQRRH